MKHVMDIAFLGLAATCFACMMFFLDTMWAGLFGILTGLYVAAAIVNQVSSDVRTTPESVPDRRWNPEGETK